MVRKNTLWCAVFSFIVSPTPLRPPTFAEAYNAMKARGSSMDAGVVLERYMKRCPEISDVKVQDVLIPIGPWEKGKKTPAGWVITLACR